MQRSKMKRLGEKKDFIFDGSGMNLSSEESLKFH